MIRILLCFSLISSLLLCGVANAQNKSAPAKPVKDTTHKAVADTARKKTAADTARIALPKDSSWYIPGGVRIGLDLSRIVTAIYYPYRKEVTVVADARINANWYAAFEAGYGSTPYSDSNYTYKGSGFYTTLGADYNFLKRQYPTEKNIFYVGMRYGFSHFNYSVPEYNNRNNYWGDNIKGSIPKTNANAHWIELVVGLKAEVLKNFFLGWNIRERIMINSVKSPDFTPITVPGFGSGSKRSVFDVQYTVSYVIPFYRLKEHAPLVELKKKKIPKK
ncbi:hypothetical protein SAMN05660909_02809 [Chitinophaga terrae (ex Kim and Jung 2007)]|uniref:DUF3575 domain-containing protein n=1 Tax=Chitinophaga terrae (ex Kim and Jung 2007) TaxID=408074 RepID=A0A1H4CU87_9BACT|nr:DUF6048 family protein [Chitinophaga terrae (ex Kim and Jung 2007)]SEA63904.1 hypothetical protein SAMN05660909_02809 [Chitinophaga terrae (ex Kim and Jung 2007)]